MNIRILLLAASALTLPACVTVRAAPAENIPATVSATANTDWAFETSDVPVDPEYRFGTLANGMRYVLRANATPPEQVLVRMEIASGSLAERDDEQGLAHFLEHMAFNGSANIPEGEMIKLLEREGLAFGADTNASTGFEYTNYRLDLPRNDTDLIDTALFIMRETASEITIAEDAVERERGVILAERRTRNGYSYQELTDRFEFLYPGARVTERWPIGTEEVLRNAPASRLRDFYEREYVPANTTLVVIGDMDVDAVEAMVRTRFADWQAAPMPAEPDPGPFDLARGGETDIYLDPSLDEQLRVTLGNAEAYPEDSVAERRENSFRDIGYAIVNRRLQSLGRLEDPPFRGAGLGTSEVFEHGRSTNLIVNTKDGGWQRGLDALVEEYARALRFGFTEGEVAEQVANVRTANENLVAGAGTRSSGTFANAALGLVREGRVPSTPQSALDRLLSYIDEITPDAVLAALRRDIVELDNPLIVFRGRTAPEGGVAALRKAWDAAISREVTPSDAAEAGEWAYTDFGPAGTVVSDTREPRYGIRQIRFANNVMLNLKPTDLQDDRVRVEYHVDGGDMLATKDDPLATTLVGLLPVGGLGAHTQDELQSLLAGRSVGWPVSSSSQTFTGSVTTTPRDLELQLQLLTASISDPGYRVNAEGQFRRNITNAFTRLNATPGAAIGNASGGILSDSDPRFTLQALDDYLALTMDGLRANISDRLANGAIELALVGDFEEEDVIALVARTFGALPRREALFREYDDNRQRSFTANRNRHVLRHTGEADQALLRLVWPTRDDSDLAEDTQLSLAARVVRLGLNEVLREELGQTYSPGASSFTSSVYPGYGSFTVSTEVDVGDVDAARDAIFALIEKLGTPGGVDEDTLERARKPALESYANALDSNGGWMSLADRAQGDPASLDRFEQFGAALPAVTPQQISAVIARYLVPDMAVEMLALPDETVASAPGDTPAE